MPDENEEMEMTLVGVDELARLREALRAIRTTAHCIAKAGPLHTPDLASAWSKFNRIAVMAAHALTSDDPPKPIQEFRAAVEKLCEKEEPRTEFRTRGIAAMLEEVKSRSAGVLEQIIREIIRHDKENPDHGIGCACHDAHAGRLRRLFQDEGVYEMKGEFRHDTKSLHNLFIVLGYVIRRS